MSLALVMLLALAALPAHAISEYRYGKHEYVIIQDGLAPNKRLSIAAHGAGDDGDDDFHLWLMAEPAHKRLAVLANISFIDNGHAGPYLDSGANAYNTVWSPDSRHVAVWFRTNRHILRLNVYAVEGYRAMLIRGPNLFHEVTGLDVKDNDNELNDYRSRIFQLTWRGANRFVLTERRIFQTDDLGFAGRLSRYGRELKTMTVDSYRPVVFSAETERQLMPGLRYRVVDLNAGKFEDYGE